MAFILFYMPNKNVLIGEKDKDLLVVADQAHDSENFSKSIRGAHYVMDFDGWFSEA